MMDFGNAADFAEWASGSTAVERIVSDLGDAAFIGPAAKGDPSMLAFRKGSRSLRLSAVKVGADGKREVTMEQMRAIADLISSRL